MNYKNLLLSMLVGVILLFGYEYWSSKQVNVFQSRLEFEKAIEFVKREKPTPPVTAIFYAKVAEKIYISNKANSIDELVMKELLQNILDEEKKLPNINLKSGNNWNEYWIKTDPQNPSTPFSPKISQYSRFLLKNFTYQVPPPPKYKSAEFYKQLSEVKEVASRRTSEQGALVNFYGGVPGTEGPSGIWQNILWENTKFDKSLTDKEYAMVQMRLAQTLADAFMECWKVKYIYQTKRPDMTDKTIQEVLAMPNPPFPSYVSGHSTISFAGAEILAHFFPNKREIFIKHATQAKNSRLWAGIHFPHDNDEGQKLGEEVAKNIINNL